MIFERVPVPKLGIEPRTFHTAVRRPIDCANEAELKEEGQIETMSGESMPRGIVFQTSEH